MPAALFYFFSALTLVFGVMVVVCRNPVASAMSLVMSFVGVAALFISLDAYFIGVIQILVYAGAVMVLFLFIIMLLDIKAQEGRKHNVVAVLSSILLAVAFTIQLSVILSNHEAGNKTLADAALNLPAAAEHAKIETIKKDLAANVLSDSKLIGETLFHRYAFQIQLIGLLLLVGTVGVVIMSKKEVD
jgi:NADH-quinone oxidoreductase subunit J